MCGIAGYAVDATARPQESLETAIRMVATLRHRGPDDEGIAAVDLRTGRVEAMRTGETAPGAGDRLRAAESAGAFPHHVALGHTRFSIIDLSPSGHQPFGSDDGDVWLTFNGEVYNYVEIRETLVAAGHRFRTTSDTEVLLHAYLEWGVDCFQRLLGFWALALHDAREGRVLLARDRMGKAPLYVARHGDAVWWASEIKALRSACGRDAFGVRAQAVSDFLATGLRDVHDLTFFEGVTSFPRASYGWLEPDGKVEAQSYWDLPTRRRSERSLPPKQAASELRDVLSDALRVRLRADVPVGVDLSGGVDSSTLTALAASHGHRLLALNVSFPGTDADEEPYARQVAERWREVVDFEVITPGHADFFDEADWFVRQMDEPFHSPNMVANQHVWRTMRAQGIRVSISGGGGDEMFCGYRERYYVPYLAWLLSHGRLLRLHNEAAALSERPARPGSHLYWSRLRAAAAHERRLHIGGRRPTLDILRAQEMLTGAPSPVWRRPAPIEREVRELATDWLMNYWLRSGHQSFMAVPIEVRGPFLDHRIVELAFTMPLGYLIRDGWFKWIIREAARDVLPDEVAFRRQKMGFPFPLDRWLRTNRERFFDIAGKASEPCPYIDLQALRSSYDRLVAEDRTMLWRALSICLWWQRCVLDEALD